MRIFMFEQEQYVERQLKQVFDFFSDARNLERITPPWLRFEVLTPDSLKMSPGTLIDYRLRLHRIPLRWRSEITVWEPPYRFVDVQRKGPYRLWEHEHRFDGIGGATRVRDRVRYSVLGGSLVQKLFVSRDIEGIFAYRAEALERLLANGDDS
jgi:ligand-binding SRPBCC domain-containing protein